MDPSTFECPDADDLDELFDAEVFQAIDGCTVEPDGFCAHGEPSCLIRWGLI